MNTQTLAGIFARGGSKGVPRKNIRLLAGKPLIAYAIETARASRLIDRVVVSTDDEEIARVAERCGAEVPFRRPPELARDDAPEWLSWQHAIRTVQAQEPALRVGCFVSVPATSPLRAVEDVDACIRLLQASDADLVVTVTPAGRSPYFNMVTLDGDGWARLVMPSAPALARRQDAPPVYDMTTVAYAARPEFVLRAASWREGRVKAVVVPRERALDIDTELDFEFAEFMVRRARNR